MMRKKLFSLLLAAVLLLSLLPTAALAEDADANILRGGFCKLVVEKFQLTEDVSGLENPFPDLSESADYYEAVLIAYRKGIISGYADGTLRPENCMARCEIAIMLQRISSSDGSKLKLPAGNLDALPSDLDEGLWYYDAAYAMLAAGVLTTLDDGTFAGNSIAKYGDIHWDAFVDGLQLPTPTNLRWGVNRQWDNTLGDWQEISCPGYAAWRCMTEQSGQALVTLYRRNGDRQEAVWSTSYFHAANEQIYMKLSIDLESGTYFFTVQEIGDGEHTDSNVAVSADWEYVRPANKLATPTTPVWAAEGNTAAWTAEPGADHWYQLLHCDTVDGEYCADGGEFSTIDEVSEGSYLLTLLVRKTGYYRLRVQSTPKDITAATSGDWSETSEAKYFDGVSWLQADMFTVDLCDEIYPGSPVTKEIQSDLVEGVDYTVSYLNNDQLGQATLQLFGMGRYYGAVFLSFNIVVNDALPKQAAPTDLHWATESGGMYMPGSLLWTSHTADETEAEQIVRVYRRNGSGAVEIYNIWRRNNDGAVQVDLGLPLGYSTEELVSGTYYFTVQELGDGINSADSEVVQSPDWVYVRPDRQLQKPATPTWDASLQRFVWPASEDVDCARYSINIEYRKTPQTTGGRMLTTSDRNYFDFGPDHPWFKMNGAGYYLIQIRRCLSRDLNVTTHSESGEWSALLYLDDAGGAVAEIMGELAPDAAFEQVQAAVKQVQELHTESLAAAIISDKDNASGGVTEQLSALEDAMKASGSITTGVAVDESLQSSFAEEKVSIVGAALNELADTNTEKILTLSLQPLNEEQEAALDIPELYDSDGCTVFSMKLEGVQNEEELEVPVKISMPVPEGITPGALRILHFHADGSMEVITPYTYVDSGQNMMSFVLTSFSNFALASERTAIEGSMFTVDTSDALCTGTAVTKKVSSILNAEDYTVRYENNTDAGTATLIVEGQGAYTGTLRYFFRICDAADRTPIHFADLTPPPGAALYAAAYDGNKMLDVRSGYTQDGGVTAALNVADARGTVTYRLFQIESGTWKPLTAAVNK